MDTLDLRPEFRVLQTELTAEKELYLTLYLKLKDLTETVKPNLEAIYAVKVGYKQLELLYRQAEVAGLKFQMELMIACMNKKEKIDLEEIQKIVQSKLQDYYTEINRQADQVIKAQERLSQLMSPEDAAELKKLYYQAAKILHPDVNPSLSEEQKQLWSIISDAYTTGDLLTLRNLTAVLHSKAGLSESIPDYDSGKQQLEFFKGRNKDLLNNIDTIQSEFPFTVKEKLYDDDWLAAEIRTIEESMKEISEAGEKYQDYINLMTEL